MRTKAAHEEELVDALRRLMADRNIRRYLALHDPDALHTAERALLEHNRARHPSSSE